MKSWLHTLLLTVLAGIIYGCKKEHSCENCSTEATIANRPPIAIAGGDQPVILPADSVLLDGSASTDPDGTIVHYRWSKVSGPSAAIVHVDKAQTTVHALEQGSYLFELTVTDNGGLSAKDTVQVVVYSGPPVSACAGNRPLIHAQLIPMGSLSQLRTATAVASAGNKILVAGGRISTGTFSTRVDFFDVTTLLRTTAELSSPRAGITSAVLGDKIFFAGGYTGIESSTRVDIFNMNTNTWTTAELTIGRSHLVGAAAGGKVLFAGGVRLTWDYTHTVDIYDAAAGTWSVASLSDRTPTGTVGITAAVVGTKVYFAGEASGWLAGSVGSFSSTINVYDAATNNWSSAAALDQPRGFMAATVAGSNMYWAGGVYRQPPGPFTDQVEIRDVHSGAVTLGCLFQPNAFFSAVQRGQQVVFFTGSGTVKNMFDIYDATTKTWSIGVLPVNIEEAAIVSVDDALYVVGGRVNGMLSDKIWRLDF